MLRPYANMLRPYPLDRGCDDDNAMDMIWHHDKCIQRDVWEMARDFDPMRYRDFPHSIQPYYATRQVAEQAQPIVRDDGDEIDPWRGVIVSFETDGTSVVIFGIMSHHFNYFHLSFTNFCVIR